MPGPVYEPSLQQNLEHEHIPIVVTTPSSPSAASTQTLDLGNINRIFTVTMPAGNLTLSVKNAQGGTGLGSMVFIVEIINTSGQGTLTWFSTVKWAGGTTPTLTGTNGKKDTFGFRVTGTATFDGYIIGQNI